MFGDFDYNVLFEFGGAGVEDAGHIQELWLQYTGLKPFRFRVGAFPPSYGLEDQGSTNGSLFLERPAISDITRSVAGGDFREAGQLVASDNKRWFANVALTTRVVGVTNSAALGGAPTFNQSFGGIARVAVLPLVGDDYLVHLGAHGSRVFNVADGGGPDVAITGRYPVQFRERPELRVDGTRLIDTGTINASHVNTVGAEVAAQKGPVMVQGEYERITVERLASALRNPHFTGWYVEGGWMLTGEHRRYNTGTFAFDGPTVDHPFDFRQGTYGAFELAARYSVTDLNYNPGQRRPRRAARRHSRRQAKDHRRRPQLVSQPGDPLHVRLSACRDRPAVTERRDLPDAGRRADRSEVQRHLAALAARLLGAAAMFTLAAAPSPRS